MTAENTDTDIVWGAEAIAKSIGLKSARQAFHKLAAGQIKGARKVGDTWALDLKVWRQSFRAE